MDIKKIGAFTLAEVLVTLGIIGIVSALTVPSLTQNWQRQAYVTQLHKVYNEFQQGLEAAMAEKQYKNVKELFMANSSTCGADAHEKSFLHDHFKVVKDCGSNTTQCFASTYKTISGNSSAASFNGYKVTIAGGSAIAFNMSGDGGSGHVYVDTNGTKGPNIWGRDMFVMTVMRDGTLDVDGMSSTQSVDNRRSLRVNYSSNCTSGNGHGCFGRILNDDWQMNY